MIIRCPNCSTTYKVSGSVFDVPKPTFRCTRCKHVFMVQVRLQLTDEETTRAAQPTTEPAGAGTRRDPADEPVARRREEPEEAYIEEDDIPPAGAEEAQDAPELPFETLEAEPESVADELTDLDTDEDDSRDAAPGYPHFQIDSLEPDPPETRPGGEVEQAAEIDDDPPDPTKRQPDFEIEDAFLMPPVRETTAPPPPRKLRADGRGSIVPVASLVGLALFAFVLVFLIYQANPQPLDSLIRSIPWYGNAVFDDRHFKRTLVLESLVSGVRPVLNQTEVFTVSGKLTNRNDRSVHKIQIEAQLFDAEGRQIARQVTFVGNAISAKIIQDMTLREISLLQSLKPQSHYQISPNGSANFTIVFPKPKGAVESFSCRVVAAEVAA